MGIPSVGIYTYELYNFYDVENIIRIGSTGGYTRDLKLFDTVLVTGAVSKSTYALYLNGEIKDLLFPSDELNDRLRRSAAALNIPLKEGYAHCSDIFYSSPNPEYDRHIIEDRKCICAEMESFGLFANANMLKKKAACLLSVSDSFVYKEEASPEERQTKFTNMIKVALEAAE